MYLPGRSGGHIGPSVRGVLCRCQPTAAIAALLSDIDAPRNVIYQGAPGCQQGRAGFFGGTAAPRRGVLARHERVEASGRLGFRLKSSGICVLVRGFVGRDADGLAPVWVLAHGRAEGPGAGHLSATAWWHGGFRPRPGGLNQAGDFAARAGVMTFGELASWSRRPWLTPAQPGSGYARRAGRSRRG
jgi:hypothetical protein